jgi:hypothetical protein
MMFLRFQNNVIEYPFSLKTIKEENPNVSFPSEISVELLAQYNVFPVVPTAPPNSTITQDPAESVPVNINGVWTQTWVMVNIPVNEAEARQRNADYAAERNLIKADTFVQNFIAMSPSQVTDYVNNNTANLAQVRSLMAKMAVMLLLLAKNEYR